VIAVLRRVLHGDDDPLGARHKVHGAAHAFHHLAGNHPVGQIALLVHLQRAQDGQVDMAAADHGKRVGAVEIRAAGRLCHGLLAGIDQVRVDLELGWIGTDAEQAVLRVQCDLDARWNMVRDERRHADAKVDVVTVAQLSSYSLDDPIAGSHVSAVAGASTRKVRFSIRFSYLSPFKMCRTKMPGVTT